MRIPCSLSLLLACVSVFSQGFSRPEASRLEAPLPENSEARTALKELFYAPADSLSSAQDRVLAQRIAGGRVRFDLRRQNGHLYYLFQNEEEASFSIAGRGNYVIKREVENGRFVQIKVFYRSDPQCYVRLFPEDGGRTSMDVYLFGRPVDRGVLLPREFQSFLTEPFARVIDLSRTTVRWQRLLFRGRGPLQERTAAHVETIRRLIPRLGDRDDGAMDGQGRYVFIESGLPQGGPGGLNCSGFAKWVTDGFFYGLTGRYLDLEPLKEKHPGSRGHRWSSRFEDERDPYFGLDWSRNLAGWLWLAQGFPAEGMRAGPEDFDVRRVEYLHYREDVGYAVKDLKLLLFLEAGENPGSFYIGSFNREYGGQPVLRQHFHMAVFFPYFTASGSFRVAVFDRARETTLETIAAEFPGCYIHLVRLPVGESFMPPGAARGRQKD
jgi:hypothetical protein